MIILTVALIFAFALYTKQQTTMDPIFAAAVHANRSECGKENGVEDLSEASKIWKDPTYPANNQALKCFYKCVCARFGIIDNGTIYDNADTMAFFSHLDDAQELKEIHDECKDIPPVADECEFAYQLFKCIAEAQLD